MADVHVTLRSALVDSYDQLVRTLKRTLRSTDLAHDVLHDTYLRLDRVQDGEVVRQPAAYVMRMAINVARDHIRKEKIRAPAAPLEAVAHLAEDGASTTDQIEARSALKAVSRALRRMPARRRAILLAAVLEGLSPPEIGKRFGLGTRAINMELKAAREFCAAEFGRPENI